MNLDIGIDKEYLSGSGSFTGGSYGHSKLS